MSHQHTFGSLARAAGRVRLVMAVLLALAGTGLVLIATPQRAGAQDCPGTVHKGVCFPTGDVSFADATVLLERGPIGDPPNGDASSPLGPPDDFTQEGGPAATPNSVSLGDRGVLVVQFTDNVLTGGGTSDADLWIFETGTATQLVDVAVSADGATWTPVGSTTSQNHGIDLDAFGFGPGSQLFFVRVQDTTPQPIPNPSSVRGADIDAIGAITTIADPGGTCNGLAATITGAGEIVGGSNHDVILGSPGDDVIYGHSGHDTICGNGGNDVIYAGSGHDQVWGEVQGEQDVLTGAPGVDQLYGESGNDLLVDGSAVGQIVDGGSGTDEIFAAGTLIGDSGDDTIAASDAGSTIDGGSGADTCTGTQQIVDCEG